MEIREEDEERKIGSADDKVFYVAAVDESESVYVFSHKSAGENFKKG